MFRIIGKTEGFHTRSEISNLKSLAESCSRQLRAWADSLQNTDIKGQRHLNDQTRAAYEHQRRSAAFWKRLEETVNKQIEAPHQDRLGMHS